VVSDRRCQIVNVAETFLVGGNETTTFLLGSILHRLATAPALAERMRAEPAGIPALVEPTLRFESPSQGMPRWPTRDVEIAGVAVPKGSTVLLMCSAGIAHEARVEGDGRRAAYHAELVPGQAEPGAVDGHLAGEGDGV
jgi:cytochrome P450